MPDSPRHCEELLRRSNLDWPRGKILDCFAALAMTGSWAPVRMLSTSRPRPTIQTTFQTPRDIPSRGTALRRKMRARTLAGLRLSCGQNDLSVPGRNNDKTHLHSPHHQLHPQSRRRAERSPHVGPGPAAL
ncbi:hypothetical protein C7G42_16345 [Bradyrhizobium sp. MOS003]|nr:hypothetical protein C7G42_16345 [Bradyrhizobium sp. MOS003]